MRLSHFANNRSSDRHKVRCRLIYFDQLAPRPATPWWMGRGRRSGTRRGAIDHRKRQKVTTARGIWPQRESGGGSLWPLLHPACYNHIFISVPPGRFCKLVNLHSNLTCHDAILKSGTTQAPRTLSKYLNIWHPAPMHCNGKMQQFWATRCQTWFPQADVWGVWENYFADLKHRCGTVNVSLFALWLCVQSWSIYPDSR